MSDFDSYEAIPDAITGEPAFRPKIPTGFTWLKTDAITGALGEDGVTARLAAQKAAVDSGEVEYVFTP